MTVDDGERVEFDSVLFQHVEAGHDAIEGRLVAFVYAIAIVEVARAVNGQADEEAVLREKFAPFVIEKHTVRLEGIFDLLAVGVFPLERDDTAKEIDAEQCGLAALPGEVDRLRLLRFDVLTDVGFEDIVRHLPI